MAKNSDEIQQKWFEKLLKQQDIIALVSNNKDGFIVGRVIAPPEVYDAGLTLMIDDFCVTKKELWNNVGKRLINKIKKIAANKGVKQILIVSGAHDQAKNNFLREMNLIVASKWFVKSI
ncbi:MAG: hypothetical protein KGQ36_03535 [Rickettsiales bacterium]|nr:hypothetical protein [Rickettsiales bacterium]